MVQYRPLEAEILHHIAQNQTSHVMVNANVRVFLLSQLKLKFN